ncbi:MAG: tetratricopeptide repeat protein [Acidobacteriota bacterium]|nr:tetratricopeptide repeat protein [Acidobacteriota bacterium]
MSRAAFVLLMAAQLFGGGERNTREGAEHFEAGRLEEALRAFSRAEGEFPDAPENDLNIAGVHYRLGEAEGAPAGEEGPLAEALRGYQAALEGGAGGAVRRDAFYNLANTLFRGGAFREAAAAYGEAIALDPDDREARQNLERALRAADEEEQQGESQDQEPQDQQPRDQEGQEQQSPQEQGQDPQDSPSSGDRDQESGQEPQPPPPDGSPQSQDQPPADDTSGSAPEDAGPGAETPDSAPGEVPEISPEQAERILAALADVERAFQEDRLEKRRARALRRGRH